MYTEISNFISNYYILLKYLQIKENSWYMYVLCILKSIGILFIKFENI